MNRKGKPTKPNKTSKSTKADKVMTRKKTAEWIVNYFKNNGTILEPCAGTNVFYDLFENKNKFRCEIDDGLDFFEWEKKVDWIITNPPYSIYDLFLKKPFEISSNGFFIIQLCLKSCGLKLIIF